MEDLLFMQIPESSDNLSQVVSNLWLSEHLTGLQDMGEGLPRKTNHNKIGLEMRNSTHYVIRAHQCGWCNAGIE